MCKDTNHYYVIDSEDQFEESKNTCDIVVAAHQFNNIESFNIKKIIIPYTEVLHWILVIILFHNSK